MPTPPLLGNVYVYVQSTLVKIVRYSMGYLSFASYPAVEVWVRYPKIAMCEFLHEDVHLMLSPNQVVLRDSTKEKQIMSLTGEVDCIMQRKVKHPASVTSMIVY